VTGPTVTLTAGPRTLLLTPPGGGNWMLSWFTMTKTASGP
jgi:hypothetical protein